MWLLHQALLLTTVVKMTVTAKLRNTCTGTCAHPAPVRGTIVTYLEDLAQWEETTVFELGSVCFACDVMAIYNLRRSASPTTCTHTEP